ncbi:MAG: hypothetical protein IH892_07160 [Planctomycetes bacterium]|nr:hypothetical protein [Planctomycetota bacterium]
MQTLKPILLLEDDDLDAMILARALRTLNVRNEIIRAEDGEKVLGCVGKLDLASSGPFSCRDLYGSLSAPG